MLSEHLQKSEPVFLCTGRPKTPCERESEMQRRRCEELFSRPRFALDTCFITSCDSDGSYSAEQCTFGIMQSCLCVSKDGAPLSRNYDLELERMDCEALRRK